MRTRGARASAALLGALLAGALPAAARAQGEITVELPRDDPFPAAPEIRVHAVTFPDSTAPRRIRLRLSLDPAGGLVVFDSTIAGDDARFTTRRLLPENREIYLQASVIDRRGQEIRTLLRLAGRTGPRLLLLSPNGLTSVSLDTRQPRFSWRSAPVDIPPGPWVYEVFVTNVDKQTTRSRLGITDSVYTWPDTLEANTSYRWGVIARLPNGFANDSVVVGSRSSFVIAPEDAPVATLLYQNFPNPFPAPSSPSTCVWFDLRTASVVTLTVHDLRGHRVRTLAAGPAPDVPLPSGRYGRRSGAGGGCDPRFTWDGTADDGRAAPPGVYLLRLQTSAGTQTRKMLYLGR